MHFARVLPLPASHHALSVVVAIAMLAIGAPAKSQQTATGQKWAVATGHPEATRVGLEVLRNGGNVIDAAVAASLTLGVAEPYGSGLGGKLVLLYHDAATGKVSCIEALCPSATATDPDEFASLSSKERKYGYRSICVPGLPAGIFAAHQKWGSKPWESLIDPAEQLARKGIVVSAKMLQLFLPHEKDLAADAQAANLFLVDGKTPTVGTRLPNPELADTLRRFAERGANGFYQGATAERIVATARAAGSPLTLADFKNYEARFSAPLVANYRGYRVYSSPPPLTGGATVLAVLRAQAALKWPPNSPRDGLYINNLGRVLQVFYPLLSEVIGDTPTALELTQDILSEDSIREAVKRVQDLNSAEQQAEPLASLSYPPNGEATVDDGPDASTTHLVIADANGNMVSLTQSLSLHFGAAVVPAGTGLLLNDSMSNFATNWKESPNYVAGGKRPRSTVAPVIATRDGRAALALGIPGGQRIPTTTIQLLVDILGSNIPIDEAFDRPRFHLRRPITARQPKNFIDLEYEGDLEQLSELRADLKQRGWLTEPKPRNGRYFGGGNAIQYLPCGKMIAVADTRRTNHAASE